MRVCLTVEELTRIFNVPQDHADLDGSICLEIPDHCIQKAPLPLRFNERTLTVECGEKSVTLSETHFAIVKYVYDHEWASYDNLRQHALNGTPITDADLEWEVGGAYETLTDAGIGYIIEMDDNRRVATLAPMYDF